MGTPDPNCEGCRGAGWAAVREPGELLAQLHRCDCQKRGDLARSIEQATGGSGLAGLRGHTFAAFDATVPGLDDAFAAAEAFAEQPDGFLVLAGGYGCGKTHLAMAIGNALLERGRPVVFLTVPDLLTQLKATFDGQAAVKFEPRWRALLTVDVLILDDLGAENKTPWAVEQIFELVNSRHAQRRPTVVTTNLDLPNASARELHPRIRSRLLDEAVAEYIGIEAADYRLIPLHERRAA